MKKIARILRNLFAVLGILAVFFVFWMLTRWPLMIDRWLDKTEAPVKADYIVCLTNGFAAHNLPTEAGWNRIYTAVQLYTDGFAGTVVISGGGAGRVTEAEVYGESARWLGLPAEALAYDPKSASTAEHPRNILTAVGADITRDSALIIVTSPHHSRRVWMSFRAEGFTDFRIVSRYTARTAGPEIVRERRASKFVEHRPVPVATDDVLLRLRLRTNAFLSALRECAGIILYRIKGHV